MFEVVTVHGTVLDTAETEEGAEALRASWFRTFPDSCFLVRPKA